eukprot:TRINITY_DN67910_c0_g1_i1.p1 TRINITY_DN67910_c0_g1~~TRINITY_DN67910_c0_g1_i1.p1  ORF type:complete len:937 (+),score=126.91 TRINITY_DN67910_c0_g1_i1:157-2967(+)
MASILTCLLVTGLAALTVVHARDSSRLERWRLAGEALQGAGRIDEAMSFYSVAISVKPDDVAALNNLGVLAQERGQAAEAEAWYGRAVAAEPSSKFAAANLGNALMARGAAAEALVYLRRSTQLGRQSEEKSGNNLDTLPRSPAATHSAQVAQRGSDDAGQSLPRSIGHVTGQRLDTDLLGVTVATRTDEAGLEMLLHSAEAVGVPIWVRGADATTLRAWGTNAGGWGIKLRAMADVAARARSNDSLVLWMDAYDVIFSPAATVSRLRDRFETMGSPVVFAAEGHCEKAQGNCVGAGGDSNGQSYPPQPYLNSGLILARAGALLDIFNRYPFTDPVDDQAYFGRIWLNEKGRGVVLVDSARRLFACPFRSVAVSRDNGAASEQPAPSEDILLHAAGHVSALGPGGDILSEPLFLHFNGPSRSLMEVSYKALFPKSFRGSSSQPHEAASGIGRVAPGDFVGMPLREGPWRCTAPLVWDESQAALCHGGSVLLDQVFVINLDRRPDRMRNVVGELKRYGLRAVRFPAVSGDAISVEEQARHDRSALRGIPKGHLGCFFSHLAVWKEVVRRRWNRVLILEDDAIFVTKEIMNFPERIQDLERVDPNWQFVYAGRNPVEVSRALLLNEGLLSHWPARRDKRLSPHLVDPGTSEGLWGYLISLAGATTLVPHFDEMLVRGITYDVDLSLHLEGPRQSLRMYAIEPPLVRQREADDFSDTSGIARGRKQLLLGHQYLQGGRFAEAETRLREAVQSMANSREKGEESITGSLIWLQEAKRYLAAARSRQSANVGDAAAQESEAFFREAADIASDRRGPAARAFAGTLSDLCYFLVTQSRFEEARGLCLRSLDVAAQANRPEDSCAAHGYLGILHEQVGRMIEAEGSFRAAVAVGEKLQVGRSRLCSDLSNLCIFLKARGRVAEAGDACSRCPTSAIDVTLGGP